MNRDLIRLAAVGFYAMVALLTFGHSAADNYRRELYNQMVCDEARAAGLQRLPPRCYSINGPKSIAAGSGAMAGAAWPLYWSWVAFQ